MADFSGTTVAAVLANEAATGCFVAAVLVVVPAAVAGALAVAGLVTADFGAVVAVSAAGFVAAVVVATGFVTVAAVLVAGLVSAMDGVLAAGAFAADAAVDVVTAGFVTAVVLLAAVADRVVSLVAAAVAVLVAVVFGAVVAGGVAVAGFVVAVVAAVAVLVAVVFGAVVAVAVVVLLAAVTVVLVAVGLVAGAVVAAPVTGFTSVSLGLLVESVVASAFFVVVDFSVADFGETFAAGFSELAKGADPTAFEGVVFGTLLALALEDNVGFVLVTPEGVTVSAVAGTDFELVTGATLLAAEVSTVVGIATTFLSWVDWPIFLPFLFARAVIVLLLFLGKLLNLVVNGGNRVDRRFKRFSYRCEVH